MGEGLSTSNLTNARVPQTTNEIFENAFVFSYHYWYPWNGCSNQLLAVQVGSLLVIH